MNIKNPLLYKKIKLAQKKINLLLAKNMGLSDFVETSGNTGDNNKCAKDKECSV